MLRALSRLSSSSTRLVAIVAPALRYFRTKHVYALAPFSNLSWVCVCVCGCNKSHEAQQTAKGTTGREKKTSNTQRINLIGQECVHKLIQRATLPLAFVGLFRVVCGPAVFRPTQVTPLNLNWICKYSWENGRTTESHAELLRH